MTQGPTNTYWSFNFLLKVEDYDQATSALALEKLKELIKTETDRELRTRLELYDQEEDL